MSVFCRGGTWTPACPPAHTDMLCRGTPAGRALFNLFSDDVNGKKSGDKFSARNKAVLEAKIAMGWRPSLPGEAGFLKTLLRMPSAGELMTFVSIHRKKLWRLTCQANCLCSQVQEGHSQQQALCSCKWQKECRHNPSRTGSQTTGDGAA